MITIHRERSDANIHAVENVDEVDTIRSYLSLVVVLWVNEFPRADALLSGEFDSRIIDEYESAERNRHESLLFGKASCRTP